MSRIFFTHSSVDRHLGCFHGPAIINSAALKTLGYKCLFLFLNLFIFGCAGFLLQRLGFSLQWFSCCGVQSPGTRASVVEAHRLSYCGLQALELRLRRCCARCNCPAARGVFSDQGSNLFPLHWQTDSYPLHHQGNPSMCLSELRFSQGIYAQ